MDSFHKELYCNKNESSSELPDTTHERVMNQGSLDIPEITKEEKLYVLNKMKNNRASGDDEIVSGLKYG